MALVLLKRQHLRSAIYYENTLNSYSSLQVNSTVFPLSHHFPLILWLHAGELVFANLKAVDAFGQVSYNIS
jgi:hypothetical protein